MADKVSNKSDTKQTGLTRDEKGRITGGTPPAGFNAHPEHRHNGAWKKEDTLRHKIEQASFLSEEELQAIIDDPSEAKLLRQFAKATLEADWRMIKEITEMLYGKPKESVDVTTQGESINPYAMLKPEELRKLAGQ